MEVFKHRTIAGFERICIRFPLKPSGLIIGAIKSVGGRYRRACGSSRACWYLPLENLGALIQSLGDDPLATMLSAIQSQDTAPEPPAPPLHSVPPPPTAPPAIDEPDSHEEPGTARPHKRQRRSVRIQPSNQCYACGYEVKMQIQTGHFHESPIPHDCGF